MDRKTLSEEICKKAGEIILHWYNKENVVIQKSDTDFVLSADLEAEKYILNAIKNSFPEDNILSEETGAIKSDGEYTWIVDPLDGTANFKAHIPYFCVSIAVMQKENLILAVVYDPVNQRLFTAEKGEGAYINKTRMHVSNTNDLKKFLMSYSTSNHKTKEVIDLGSQCFNNILHNCRAVRLQGSSLLDLCNVANGTFDGLVKVGASYWDFAAGCLMVEEAGGKVTDFDGNSWIDVTANLLASNGLLHEVLLRVIRN